MDHGTNVRGVVGNEKEKRFKTTWNTSKNLKNIMR